MCPRPITCGHKKPWAFTSLATQKSLLLSIGGGRKIIYNSVTFSEKIFSLRYLKALRLRLSRKKKGRRKRRGAIYIFFPSKTKSRGSNEDLLMTRPLERFTWRLEINFFLSRYSRLFINRRDEGRRRKNLEKGRALRDKVRARRKEKKREVKKIAPLAPPKLHARQMRHRAGKAVARCTFYLYLNSRKGACREGEPGILNTYSLHSQLA